MTFNTLYFYNFVKNNQNAANILGSFSKQLTKMCKKNRSQFLATVSFYKKISKFKIDNPRRLNYGTVSVSYLEP